MNELMTYPLNDYRDYLSHHGIMGQKWGIQNGPPYPLSFNDHSAAEKKHLSSKTIISSTSKKASADNSSIESDDHSKSDKTELYLYLANVGLDIVTLNPVYAAIDAKRAVDAAHSAVKTKKVEKMRAECQVDKKTGLLKKSKEFSEKEDMYNVNPSFKNFDKNTKANCMLCTTAYDIRRRGYEVSAKKASKGYEMDDVTKWYKNAKVNEISKADSKKTLSSTFGLNKELTRKVTDELTKQGDGARGNLMMIWNAAGSGHSVVYEVNDGKLTLRDCQSNKTYTNPGRLLNSAIGASYVRLDTATPNYDALKKGVIR